MNSNRRVFDSELIFNFTFHRRQVNQALKITRGTSLAFERKINHLPIVIDQSAN